MGLPVYSWGCAAGHAIRMAARLTGRSQVLVPRAIDPERLAVIRTYCEPPELPGHIEIVAVGFDPPAAASTSTSSGARCPARTAAVYFETPALPGGDRGRRGARSSALAHAAGRRDDRGRRPDLAGRAGAPGQYGADIAVGTDADRSAST